MNKDQRGIAGLEAILILIIVGIIGFTGWYVWNSRQQTDKNLVNATSASKNLPEYKKAISSNSSSQSFVLVQDGYLSIPDWRVRIPVTPAMLDFKTNTPKTSAYSKSDQFVDIITPSLDTGWRCLEDQGFKGSIGGISRTTQSKRAGPYEPLATKRIGNYTYGFEPGGSNCTSDANYQKLVDAFKVQFNSLDSY
jgi:hypothetical protein